MSHNSERKEKDCLNCRAVIYGRYCHVCGQENIEIKESFLHLVTHFIYDITHFDSKFFSSVKYLLLRPGFLSAEYMRGRRASYLNPIKMYVFISAFFFLFFFSVINPGLSGSDNKKKQTSASKVKNQINKRIGIYEEAVKDAETPEFARELMEKQIPLLQQDLKSIEKDSLNLEDLHFNRLTLNTLNLKYKDVEYYDSVQQALPKDKRDSWFQKVFQRKSLQIDSKYGGSENSFLDSLWQKYIHSFPQVMFISLPLFALLLQLLYYKRKNYYYADHGIFTVHLYSAMYILMFFQLLFMHFSEKAYLHWLGYLTTPVSIFILWYQYKALKNFYGQSRKKTILKDILLILLAFTVMPILFLVFFFISVFNM